MIIVAFMMMNLFIAIICESYELRMRIELSKVPGICFKEFVTEWAEFDHDGNGMIDCADAKKMFLKLPPPLGLPKEYRTYDLANTVMTRIKIPVYKDT